MDRLEVIKNKAHWHTEDVRWLISEVERLSVELISAQCNVAQLQEVDIPSHRARIVELEAKLARYKDPVT